MTNHKANKQAQRRKDLERKKFLLGNAFLALSAKNTGEFSSETILTFIESKAKSARDKKLVEELRKKIPENFSWRMESSEPALKIQVVSLKERMENFERNLFSQKEHLKFISEENDSLEPMIKRLQTTFEKLDTDIDNHSRRIPKLETIATWAVLLSIPHIIITLYMFFMFRVIPAN